MSKKSARHAPIILNERLIVQAVISFLELFMARTYAAMAVGFILFAAGLTPKQSRELTGVKTVKTVRNWRNRLSAAAECSDIHALLHRPEVDLGTSGEILGKTSLRN